MVDITKIVEKGMKEGDKPKPKKNMPPKEKTALDDLFGERNEEDNSSSERAQFSKKLGDLFGVEEENDG